MADEKDSTEATKKSLVSLIGTLLSKYRTQKDANVKDILMLIAAIGMLNVDVDNNYAVSVARRLVAKGK